MASLQKVVVALLVFVAAFIFTRSIMQKKSPLQTLIDSASDVAQFTTRGLRNNNPGNIRIGSSQWRGKIAAQYNTDGAFEQFDTPENGIRALDKLLTNYRAAGHDTIELMVSRYAPGTENDTEAYINAVAKNTGVARDVPYPSGLSSRIKLARAIIKHENGLDPYTDALMMRAIV